VVDHNNFHNINAIRQEKGRGEAMIIEHIIALFFIPLLALYLYYAIFDP
jgi:hypothetical protein